MTTLKLPRAEAKGIPHTDQLDLMLPTDQNILEAFSGHIPITLQTFTMLLSTLEAKERVFLWQIIFELIQEVANTHGWFFADMSFSRSYDIDADEDLSLLHEYEESANQVVDLVWGLKTLIQENGIVSFLVIARKLDETETLTFENLVAALEEKLGRSVFED